MLWKAPIFSFLKNVSGIHTLLASVSVRYRILSEIKVELVLAKTPALHSLGSQGLTKSRKTNIHLAAL